jgi:PAS domain S-box-containing protein
LVDRKVAAVPPEYTLGRRLQHRQGFTSTLIARGREILRLLAASRHGIGVRLLIGVLLFGSFVTLILTAVQLYGDYRRDVADVESRLERIGDLYLNSLAEGLWNLDERQLRLQLDALLRLPDIRGVEIREANSTGNVPFLKLGRDDPEEGTLAREYLLHRSVQGQDRVLGTLRVEATLADVYRRLANSPLSILAWRAAMVFLISLFIFFLFHRLVTRHLFAIAAEVGSHGIKDSPLELRLRRRPSRHEDELQRVVTSFNALSRNLHTAYRDLTQREAKIRRLVDANIIGIFTWQLGGRHEAGDAVFLDVNDAFLRIVGYDREDLVTGPVGQRILTPPDWQDRTRRAMAEMKLNGAFQPFEKEYIRKDGSRVPVLVGAARLDETENQGVAFVLDLTERKRAEAALHERAQLLDLTHDTIFVRNMNGVISFWNRGAEQLYGWTRDEALGQITHQLLRTIFPASLEEITAEVLSTGRWEGELVHTKRDGTQVIVASRWSLQRDERGRPIGILETNNDITERKQAEYLTGQVFERSPDSICIVGKDYRLQRVNPVFEQLWGPATVVVGMHLAEVIGTEIFERDAKPNLARCFAGEEVNTADWYVTPRGRRYRLITHSPLRRDQQLVEAAIVIGRDFTDHVLASEALRAAQMELAHVNRVTTMGQLTASIAHEVNQPIAGIAASGQAALRWLAKDAPDLEAVRQSIERVIRDAGRAGSVIARIRDVIKKAPRRNDRFNINEAVGEVIELTRGEALKDGVSLQTQLAAGLPLVEGDRVELQQVILNLIINAIQAMSGTSEAMRDVLITTSRLEPNSVLVAVKDSGPGLALASADDIFEPFYTTKPGGLGMGLSICRSIIEAHGGRLWLTENVPRGAIFQFTVPARRSDS